jgi:uncharacterized membrane protein YgcG
VIARILIAALALFACTGASAEERILAYGVEVQINADGSLDVTERITVRAEGNQIRRGLYRDFPTRYRDRYGNRVVVALEVLGVLRNDEAEPWFTEERDNGVRINTGNDDFLPVPADYTYTLRYRTTRQLGFFADHDELYWNAIGHSWIFPIDRGRVDVFLPAPVAVDKMTAEGYTGAQGSKEQAYRAEILEPGHARWEVTRVLQPSEGFTIVLSFPKGLIAAPSGVQRILWLLQDNRGLLIAVIGLILLIVYCVREWSRVGRDPRRGVIIARYEPPEGQTPASLRFLMRMSYDMRCFSSDVLALAVGGCLRIVRDDGFFKDEWRLESTASPPTGSSAGQRALLARLFKDGERTLVLKKTNAQTLSGARRAHSKAINNALEPRYYTQNNGSIAKGILLAAATGLLAFWISGEAGKPAVAVVGALMVIALLIFGRLVKAPTDEGRKLMDEIEGLKLYLSVAERDELARMSEPGAPRPALDEKRYEMLLPYAVALEVEDAWTKKFTAAVGVAAAAEATRRIGWYQGGGVSDLGSLSRAVGSSLTSQIASSATPPGSSSGAGGGGSSGGGGGGGGGGGR